MPGHLAARIWRPASIVRSKVIQAVGLHRPTIIVALFALLIGTLLAGLTSRIDPSEQIVVGNTGGTLTTLINLNEARILVGAGPSRSHAADLIGRTTRPWDRDIDLLVLPGWDDHHVAGGLGLLERRAISGIAVIGLPGEEPSWTLLEREAERQDVPLVHLDRSSQLQVAEFTTLSFSEVSQNRNGSWIKVAHHGKHIDIVDSADASTATPDPQALPSAAGHVLINTRGQSAPDGNSPDLLASPSPFWQQDFSEIASPYWVSIDRNEHVRLTLGPHEVRIPIDDIDLRPD